MLAAQWLVGSHLERTYSQPRQVETYVKSLTHNWLGRSARNRRLTRSCGQGALASPTVVRTAHRTTRAQPAHQSLDRTAGHDNAFACRLPPHLVGTVDLHVALPDTFNLWRQHLVALRPGAALVRLPQQRCVS